MKKVLIVDDEPNILMSLEYAFKKREFEVFVATDGTEALDIAIKERPDVILLDIRMPQMDGYETLKHIRRDKNLCKTKVVFLSSKAWPSDIENGLQLGADGYLTKPFSVKKVINNIEELLS
ncbi:hypothetical protein MTsPCn9_10890 [Croceitalea sp. MTPC9]|uniref:response regulator n=1 Tax=unclassified Croceitalea TaxID=2632280 RepID=UPI002B38607D|nr:hypothetical protein MTsPCn6_26350 [Croceitalea sp. MTPC6]GMN16153.1 hypothetical protein MTsPCn9_10890 [Croceitalea sp. MTPC9]